MDNSEQTGFRELEKPPTLVAESESEKMSDRGAGGRRTVADAMASGEEKIAKMPVLHPNVGIATRTKSGRIHKPTRNFNSDEYVVPALVKRRIPNNSRASVQKEKLPPPPPLIEAAKAVSSEIDSIRSKLEEKFPKAVADNEETPFTYISSICFKEHERFPNMSVADIHAKVKNTYKTWTKGPYRLKEDEIKFVTECIVKPEWSRISVKEWRILAEALKDRMSRMRKRFSRVGRMAKKRREDLKKTFTNLGIQILKGTQPQANVSEDEVDDDSDSLEQTEEEMSSSSTSTSLKLSLRSKSAPAKEDGGTSSQPLRPSLRSKPASTATGRGRSIDAIASNEDFGLSLGDDKLDDLDEVDLKDEMFDDLDSALITETNSKDGGESSMVAALHATLQSGNIDQSQFEPPTLRKDHSLLALEEMEGTENVFDSMMDPTFGDTEPSALTDEAFAELEGRISEDEDMDTNELDENFPGGKRSINSLSSNFPDDLGTLEIEESSGNMRLSGSGGDLTSPGVTMISTKTALMCALKISEDFLPSTHEKYLNRLEEMEKYRHDELDDIRRKFNMKPSVTKRKLSMEQVDLGNKKAKVALKDFNGPAPVLKPKQGIPYLRSAYARCRKFMEDETTVIEKLGNNKILAAGKIIEIDYENYIKESDVQIPFDDASDQMQKLLPPSVSNCHAPPCRLGCICASISEDIPPRKHCGRPRCFFECTCQQLLFNNNDDGDIRSRLRPRVSLLNWRAESTEKEKEPMTSYRQMERGTHFIRVRRTAVSTERMRRDFVLDGKVVERSTSKVTKERLRTKALLQSSHRRIMGKHDPHHKFYKIVPGKGEQQLKPKPSVDQMRKKCTPITVDVKHLDIEITPVVPAKPQVAQKKQVFLAVKYPPPPAMAAQEMEEMNSILQEISEDCQLFALDHKMGFFSWYKDSVHPRVVMYQVEQGDEFKVPWLYLPIPPEGYTWICHYLSSTFEKTDYVYIPEIKCSISSHALRVNMNTAFVRKKAVVFDVKSSSTPPGIGKLYFFPDLPKVLVCGPFRTNQTTVDPLDSGTAISIGRALDHMEKLRLMNRFGDDRSWKKFTSSPTIYPIKRRNDNETILSVEDSRKLFAQIYPNLVNVTAFNKRNNTTVQKPVTPQPALNGWSSAMKFVGFGGAKLKSNTFEKSLTEVVTLI